LKRGNRHSGGNSKVEYLILNLDEAEEEEVGGEATSAGFTGANMKRILTKKKRFGGDG